MADKRTNRKQSIRLEKDYLTIDLHKSLFINDKMKTIEASYVLSWGEKIVSKHNKGHKWPSIQIDYYPPSQSESTKKLNFNIDLTISNSKNRNKESCYRLKWNKDFSIQLANDYPKSFVRAMEYEIGDEYYKEKGYSEYDVGGFKEQMQICIKWDENNPTKAPEIIVKELFRVPDDSLIFPNVFKDLSRYYIANFLLGNADEKLRKIERVDWSSRENLIKEVKENNIYLLINKSSREIYLGETKESLKNRYPSRTKHHNFDNWEEYSIIHLPMYTTDFERRMIERVMIESYASLFPNSLKIKPAFQDANIKLVNRKK